MGAPSPGIPLLPRTGDRDADGGREAASFFPPSASPPGAHGETRLWLAPARVTPSIARPSAQCHPPEAFPSVPEAAVPGKRRAPGSKSAFLTKWDWIPGQRNRARGPETPARARRKLARLRGGGPRAAAGGSAGRGWGTCAGRTTKVQREVGTFRSREVATCGGQGVGVPPGRRALQVVRGQGKPLRRDLKAGKSQVAHLREREARGALQGPLGRSGSGGGRGGCGRRRSEERPWGRLRLRGRPVVVSVEQVLD